MQRVRRATAVAVLPADPVGGTPGYFAMPNPGGGIPATVPGYEWYNDVQEELCAVILAAGITLDGSNRAQLLAALRSGVLFSTPPQFDNDTSVATTEFVRRQGLQAAGRVYKGVGSILTADDVGKVVVLSVDNASCTLPDASTVPLGAIFEFSATTAGITTSVICAAGDTIAFGPTSVSTVILRNGDTLRLVANSNDSWLSIGGSAALQYSDSFAKSQVTNGYQKLPGGLILQWGTFTSSATVGTAVAVTWPIAFPTAAVALSVITDNNVTANSAAWFDTPTVTGFNGRSVIASRPIRWFSIGF